MDIGIHVIRKSDYLVHFDDTSKGPCYIPDIVALAQKIVKLLLTNRETDLYSNLIFGETEGGNFEEVVSRYDSETPLALIRNEVEGILKRIVDFIKSEQVRFNLPESHKLKRAEWTEIYRDVNTLDLIFNMEVENMTGDVFNTYINDKAIRNFVEY